MKEQERLVEVSKFLSLILRHRPEKIGLQLDSEGWLVIDDLILASAKSSKPLNREQINRVVANDKKTRFAISEDGRKIRANQGHSISKLELNLEPTVPPEILYHGTVEKFVVSIRETGLQRRNRNHVHLSADQSTATKVGMRRGIPVVLTIQSAMMHSEGSLFFLSQNGVWLTKSVPTRFIQFPNDI